MFQQNKRKTYKITGVSINNNITKGIDNNSIIDRNTARTASLIETQQEQHHC